jgi:Zn-dependent protease with chaperone function
MQVEQFKAMVTRLERESAAAPSAYRAKVAALVLLGFAILAFMLAIAGLGLLLLVGFVIAVVVTGGGALLLLLKLGKVLFLLAIPLWFLVKASVQALFVRVPPPLGREITRAQAPALFTAMDDMRRKMRGPRFHHVLVVDDVNAAVVQRPMFGIVGWPRNYLLLGLPLLESMPPAEALAVVAHEYGHLAGSHGHFSAFVYRLRHTWGTVQAYTDHIKGWVGWMVGPLVRWYAPYFNAYTFVLARADEYQADAASAKLVGKRAAANALKRVNLVAPQHQRFMELTFERIMHDQAPPADLMQRWATQATVPPAAADAERWLTGALDREGHFTDSHPTLRARLTALALGVPTALAALAALPRAPAAGAQPVAGTEPAAEGSKAARLAVVLQEQPQPLQGDSAAAAWLGPLLETLRTEFQTTWAAQVAEPWSERHAQAEQQRTRLAELAALPERDAAQEIERIRLTLRLETETDLREPLAAFNAQHAEHALGLFLHGTVCLDKGDAAGLTLLERAIALDPEATKPACEHAHRFLHERKDTAGAETWAERWRQRDQLEINRDEQLRVMDPHHALAPHGLDESAVLAIKQVLAIRGSANKPLAWVKEAYLARRVVPADPTAIQIVLAVQLSWWAHQTNKQAAVIAQLVAMDWPVTLVFVTLDGPLKPMAAKFRAMVGARLV